MLDHPEADGLRSTGDEVVCSLLAEGLLASDREADPPALGDHHDG
jgi:hypothetical protein